MSERTPLEVTLALKVARLEARVEALRELLLSDAETDESGGTILIALTGDEYEKMHALLEASDE